jgi:hypothetical protein
MGRTPCREALKSRTRLVTEWRKLHIAHSPATVELLNNKLAVQEEPQL